MECNSNEKPMQRNQNQTSSNYNLINNNSSLEKADKVSKNKDKRLMKNNNNTQKPRETLMPFQKGNIFKKILGAVESHEETKHKNKSHRNAYDRPNINEGSRTDSSISVSGNTSQCSSNENVIPVACSLGKTKAKSEKTTSNFENNQCCKNASNERSKNTCDEMGDEKKGSRSNSIVKQRDELKSYKEKEKSNEQTSQDAQKFDGKKKMHKVGNTEQHRAMNAETDVEKTSSCNKKTCKSEMNNYYADKSLEGNKDQKVIIDVEREKSPRNETKNLDAGNTLNADVSDTRDLLSISLCGSNLIKSNELQNNYLTSYIGFPPLDYPTALLPTSGKLFDDYFGLSSDSSLSSKSDTTKNIYDSGITRRESHAKNPEPKSFSYSSMKNEPFTKVLSKNKRSNEKLHKKQQTPSLNTALQTTGFSSQNFQQQFNYNNLYATPSIPIPPHKTLSAPEATNKPKDSGISPMSLHKNYQESLFAACNCSHPSPSHACAARHEVYGVLNPLFDDRLWPPKGNLSQNFEPNRSTRITAPESSEMDGICRNTLPSYLLSGNTDLSGSPQIEGNSFAMLPQYTEDELMIPSLGNIYTSNLYSGAAFSDSEVKVVGYPSCYDFGLKANQVNTESAKYKNFLSMSPNPSCAIGGMTTRNMGMNLGRNSVSIPENISGQKINQFASHLAPSSYFQTEFSEGMNEGKRSHVDSKTISKQSLTLTQTIQNKSVANDTQLDHNRTEKIMDDNIPVPFSISANTRENETINNKITNNSKKIVSVESSNHTTVKSLFDPSTLMRDPGSNFISPGSGEIIMPFTPQNLEEELMYPDTYTQGSKIIQNWNAREQDFFLGAPNRKPKSNQRPLSAEGNELTRKDRRPCGEGNQSEIWTVTDPQFHSYNRNDDIDENISGNKLNGDVCRISTNKTDAVLAKPSSRDLKHLRSMPVNYTEKRYSLPSLTEFDNFDRDEYVTFKQRLMGAKQEIPRCLRLNPFEPWDESLFDSQPPVFNEKLDANRGLTSSNERDFEDNVLRSSTQKQAHDSQGTNSDKLSDIETKFTSSKKTQKKKKVITKQRSILYEGDEAEEIIENPEIVSNMQGAKQCNREEFEVSEERERSEYETGDSITDAKAYSEVSAIDENLGKSTDSENANCSSIQKDILDHTKQNCTTLGASNLMPTNKVETIIEDKISSGGILHKISITTTNGTEEDVTSSLTAITNTNVKNEIEKIQEKENEIGKPSAVSQTMEGEYSSFNSMAEKTINSNGVTLSKVRSDEGFVAIELTGIPINGSDAEGEDALNLEVGESNKVLGGIEAWHEPKKDANTVTQRHSSSGGSITQAVSDLQTKGAFGEITQEFNTQTNGSEYKEVIVSVFMENEVSSKGSEEENLSGKINVEISSGNEENEQAREELLHKLIEISSSTVATDGDLKSSSNTEVLGNSLIPNQNTETPADTERVFTVSIPSSERVADESGIRSSGSHSRDSSENSGESKRSLPLLDRRARAAKVKGKLKIRIDSSSSRSSLNEEWSDSDPVKYCDDSHAHASHPNKKVGVKAADAQNKTTKQILPGQKDDHFTKDNENKRSSGEIGTKIDYCEAQIETDHETESRTVSKRFEYKGDTPRPDAYADSPQEVPNFAVIESYCSSPNIGSKDIAKETVREFPSTVEKKLSNNNKNYERNLENESPGLIILENPASMENFSPIQRRAFSQEIIKGLREGQLTRNLLERKCFLGASEELLREKTMYLKRKAEKRQKRNENDSNDASSDDDSYRQSEFQDISSKALPSNTSYYDDTKSTSNEPTHEISDVIIDNNFETTNEYFPAKNYHYLQRRNREVTSLSGTRFSQASCNNEISDFPDLRSERYVRVVSALEAEKLLIDTEGAKKHDVSRDNFHGQAENEGSLIGKKMSVPELTVDYCRKGRRESSATAEKYNPHPHCTSIELNRSSEASDRTSSKVNDSIRKTTTVKLEPGTSRSNAALITSPRHMRMNDQPVEKFESYATNDKNTNLTRNKDLNCRRPSEAHLNVNFPDSRSRSKSPMMMNSIPRNHERRFSEGSATRNPNKSPVFPIPKPSDSRRYSSFGLDAHKSQAQHSTRLSRERSSGRIYPQQNTFASELQESQQGSKLCTSEQYTLAAPHPSGAREKTADALRSADAKSSLDRCHRHSYSSSSSESTSDSDSSSDDDSSTDSSSDSSSALEDLAHLSLYS